jgi:hypothetical protein
MVTGILCSVPLHLIAKPASVGVTVHAEVLPFELGPELSRHPLQYLLYNVVGTSSSMIELGGMTRLTSLSRGDFKVVKYQLNLCRIL